VAPHRQADQAVASTPLVIRGRRATRLAQVIHSVFRFILRNPVWIFELALTAWLGWLFLTSAGFRALLAHLAQVAFAGARAASALLHTDTQGTAAALGITLLKMVPGVVAVLALAVRLRGWERLRLPLWGLLLLGIFPLACTVAWTPLRIGALTTLAALAAWLTKYPWLRWTVLLPLALYLEVFALHFLAHPVVRTFLAHRPLPVLTRSLVARCNQNDGQRPLNLHDEQLGPYYFSLARLHDDELLLTNVGTGLSREAGKAPENFSSWWLRRQGEGWVFDDRSAVAGYLQNGCLINDEIWMNEDRGRVVVGVLRDPASRRESLRFIPLNAGSNNMALPVCRPERGSVIVSETMSGNRMWEVSVDTETVRQMGYEPGGVIWAARGHNSADLTINDASDLMVYSLQDERVSQRIPAGVFMFNRHETCPLDDAVALADMTGRVRLFAREPDGRYRFDWGISLPSPRNVAFSPDCRFLGVTSMDDTTVSLVDLGMRKVVATYHVGPVLREILFLGPRELAVTDACTLTTFRF